MSECCNYKIEYITPFWRDLKAWWHATINTSHCLLGCGIGDFGMIIFLQSYYPKLSFGVIMIFAMISGIFTSIALETIILRIREKFSWKQALKTAFTMSITSMIVMELSGNLTDYYLTGGTVPTSDPWYWYALLIALFAGFIVPLPYNYYKIKKFGKKCHG